MISTLEAVTEFILTAIGLCLVAVEWVDRLFRRADLEKLDHIVALVRREMP